jgi:hypothetical protein
LLGTISGVSVAFVALAAPVAADDTSGPQLIEQNSNEGITAKRSARPRRAPDLQPQRPTRRPIGVNRNPNAVIEAPAASTLGPFPGTLYFSEDNNGNGLYTLSMVNGSATNVGISGVNGSTVGLAPTNVATLLYGSKFATLLHIQSDGSGFADVGGIGNEALAFDAATGTLYGAINGAFRTIDPNNGALLAPLASPPGNVDIEGIAFGNGGVYGLVGFAQPDTLLYFYNPGTNNWSVVGDTFIDWNLVGLAYSAAENRLYAKGSQDTFLYRIDPTTAATVVVGDTGIGNGGGLAWFGPTGPGKNILVYDDNSVHQYAVQAATNIDAAGTVVADATNFNTLLVSQSWDMVAVDAPSNIPAGGWTPLIAYVQAGGCVMMSFWDWDNDAGFGDPALPGAFDVQVVNSISLVGQTLDDSGTSGLFAGVTMPNSDWDDVFGDDGDEFNPLGTAVGVAHIGNPATPVMVRGNEGRTIAAFLIDEAGDTWQNDGSAVQLWENMLWTCQCLPDCPADLNGNGTVDFADILAVISAWGPCP